MSDRRAVRVCVSPPLGRGAAALLLLLPSLIACHPEPSEEHALESEWTGTEPFIAVYRDDAGASRSMRTVAPLMSALRQALPDQKQGDAFYLAIRREELGQRFFLSSFLRQFYPQPLPGHAPLSTRVVSFAVQNGSVVVFDREERHRFSGTYSPEILIDTFPVVKDHRAFNRWSRSQDYVLFDPAAGRNAFSVMGTIRGTVAPNALQDTGMALETHSTYLQAFRAVPDGVTFEKVFGATMESNGKVLNHAGTLGIALRRYQESEHFQKLPSPSREHFFASPVQRVPNTAQVQTFATKWNIVEGMPPIEWVISPEVLELQKSPAFAGVDVQGAIQRGVLAWNDAFGFPVLSARLGTAEDNEGQDDKNFIIVDRNPSASSAMGHVRANPNTGEIRGASIYLGSGMLEYLFGLGGVTRLHALSVPQPSPPEHEGEAEDDAGALSSDIRLTWDGQPHAALCRFDAAELAKATLLRREAAEWTGQPREEVPLSPAEKASRLIQWLVMHEVGHTLGLRHNFKGSLSAPVSSVMDYLLPEDQYRLEGPAPYDRDALRVLYGGTAELASHAFCTDGADAFDPDCAAYDIGVAPFEQEYAPMYASLTAEWLKGNDAVSAAMTGYTEKVLRYAQLATHPATSLARYNLLMEGIRPPLSQALLSSSPHAAAKADRLAHNVLLRLYGGGKVPTSPALTAQVLADLGGVLENRDGARSFLARRFAVDTLKKFQSPGAYEVLLDAKGVIEKERESATGEARTLLGDLALRLERAVTPYFQ